MSDGGQEGQEGQEGQTRPPVIHVIHAQVGPAVLGTAAIVGTARIARFHDRIYEAAQRMVQQPDADEFSFAAAIAILGAACETSAQLTIGVVIGEKKLGPIAEAAQASIRSYHLHEPHSRRVWNAVTGDTIENEAFWLSYTKHVDRRNKVVHGATIDGKPPTQADAKASLDVVRKFLDHMKSVLEANGLSQYA